MISDYELAEYLLCTEGNVLIASALAGVSVEAFSERLKKSSIIQDAQAEVGAVNLVTNYSELIAGIEAKEPWAIMFWLDSSGRFGGAEARRYYRNQ